MVEKIVFQSMQEYKNEQWIEFISWVLGVILFITIASLIYSGMSGGMAIVIGFIVVILLFLKKTRKTFLMILFIGILILVISSSLVEKFNERAKESILGGEDISAKTSESYVFRNSLFQKEITINLSSAFPMEVYIFKHQEPFWANGNYSLANIYEGCLSSNQRRVVLKCNISGGILVIKNQQNKDNTYLLEISQNGEKINDFGNIFYSKQEKNYGEIKVLLDEIESIINRYKREEPGLLASPRGYDGLKYDPKRTPRFTTLNNLFESNVIRFEECIKNKDLCENVLTATRSINKSLHNPDFQ
jgi:hypothetical protein